jgi:hypothetical protein
MAEGGNEKLLLEAVPLDDAGEYEIPDARPLEQLETYVPSCTHIVLLPLTLQGYKFQISGFLRNSLQVILHSQLLQLLRILPSRRCRKTQFLKLSPHHQRRK